jgi:acyl-CoA thioesterase-1
MGVFIIGGSNSIACTPFVRGALAAKATVDRIPDNARSTRYTLERIEEWLGPRRWDAIYFNWGMHDLTRLDGGVPQVPLPEYVSNLEKLVVRLSKNSNHLLWGTTAAMLPELQPKRRLEDVLAYNEAARQVMEVKFKLPVHDLFLLTSERPELLGEDGLHFSPEGCRVVGESIADFIGGYCLILKHPDTQ